ncbi:unnamed protein product [Arctia plantaginis]|uniref:ATP synthase F1 subunit epsilon n=1 Tax=Arctia plantaginis TaxID=874455 RepID=A0A8S0Z034_ARCPL|nr:unnamed protein product [Arctia plantaginis]CAB3236210.1 unnamed protein product [Arctia plantaginis]CAB3260632.1 unnamed protein product [Arctia plantaginis]
MRSVARARMCLLHATGELGCGAGKGGGGGGSIREAGGAFGKLEAGREEAYFYKKQKDQLIHLKKHLDDEISHHRESIKRHEDAIKRHYRKIEEIEHHSK